MNNEMLLARRRIMMAKQSGAVPSADMVSESLEGLEAVTKARACGGELV